MSKLSLFYPVKPLHINQPFGANPDYYAKFHDSLGNPEKGHMGIDFMAIHGQPVYAAIDGMATYTTDAHGGEGCIVHTDRMYDYSGGTCWFNIVNWHLIGDTDSRYPKPFISKQVKAGDLIGYADNTGAPFESAGDHLHFGLVPVDLNGKAFFPANGFGGNIDALPYFNGYFATDAQTVFTKLRLMISLLTGYLSSASKT